MRLAQRTRESVKEGRVTGWEEGSHGQGTTAVAVMKRMGLGCSSDCGDGGRKEKLETLGRKNGGSLLWRVKEVE